MPILNPDHLLKQAEVLTKPPLAGPPLQVDVRRAIFSAYYAVFHFTAARLADEFVGFSQRTTKRYALICRCLDHGALRKLCREFSKLKLSAEYLAYVPGGVPGPDIQAFATASVDLQARRHRADYDPLPRFRTADAQLAVQTARSAIARFNTAPVEIRKAFLTLLLAPPRPL